MGKYRELNCEQWIFDLANDLNNESKRKQALQNIAHYQCKEAVPLLKELYKTKHDLKITIKCVLEELNEDFEIPSSGFDFPGNLSFSEINYVLKFFDGFGSIKYNWNRFEKNRILNSVVDTSREKLFRELDSHNLYFVESNAVAERINEVLQLAERSGNIKIKKTPTPDETKRMIEETYDFIGEFRSKKAKRKSYKASAEKFEIFHEKCRTLLQKLPSRSINFHNYQEAFKNLADHARRQGILALEDVIGFTEDKFLANGLQLVVDGTEPEIVKLILDFHKNKILYDNSRLLDLIEKSILMIQNGDNPRMIDNLFLFTSEKTELA
ncbi:hypothetical protein ND861_09465 [Leptospira sp. 2 VSF19]|uniref:Uncharacterized protein n=2 Tax=Leptospira TaxID=171 RepID=A0AAW5VDL4_9LEPT|nr:MULTISPECIES: hypothetical protein [Leptospira]MCW7467635.1 hypothetical protein [Leptospira levettii]MCW7492567.1 hypothetical protein [Leptospira soteropolitanensis]MCW7500615.1 hypothetical protein [Leptospira soteropolitanensis]MCW7513315.1 hypothetical protein [Leptospira levettii]MCW7517038.1 hypothetical protein [Leptospira levettii]